MTRKEILLPVCYFAPIQWYSKIVSCEKACLEIQETFPKQTYRNRCLILGGNGVLKLTVPVIKPQGNGTKTKDVQIDYRENWPTVHWRSILSAYKNSPFFEFYQDDLDPVFKRNYKYLVDLNLEIHAILSALLPLENTGETTGSYRFPSDLDPGAPDFREIISPKKKLSADPEFKVEEYRQVFSERHGFIPNLSILDLLFNKGPESALFLKESFSPGILPG